MLSSVEMSDMIKGVELGVPQLELKNNSELECWRDFIERFEIALINTNLAIEPEGIENKTESKPGSSGATSTGMADVENDFRRGGLLLNAIRQEGYKMFTKWKIAARDISYANLIN